MFVRDYGPEDAPVILALHPMGITGENLYQTFAPYLKGEYRVIAPDQGGHGKSGHYMSFQDEVDAAYELMKDPSLHFENGR